MKPGLRRHKKRQARIAVTNTANKIARVEKTELDRTFHTQLAEVKRLRDAELAEAGSAYRKALNDARDAHNAERNESWSRYDERRDTILKSLASHDEQVAA